MIIHRALYREATRTTLAIALVLLTIFTFLTLTILLGRAAEGENSDIVPLLLGLQMLRRLDTLLPLALYLGLLLTLGRWYRDNEMTVLAACGVGVPQLLRPVLTLALAFAAVVGTVAFYLSPLINRQIDAAKNESSHRPVLSGIATGVFTEFPGRQLIVYVEGLDPDSGNLRGVFVSRAEKDRQSVVLAQSGTPYRDKATGDKFLKLKNGVLYEGAPGQANYRILEFASYAIRIEQKKVNAPPVTIDGVPSSTLWGRSDPYAVAEWHWRLSRPLLTLVLAAFGVALAYTDARRGRLSNLFAAVLVYFIYSNVLALGQTLLTRSQIPTVLGLWWVHAAAAALAAYFIWRRVHNLPLVVLPRRSRSPR